jgi:hypothetical protein
MPVLNKRKRSFGNRRHGEEGFAVDLVGSDFVRILCQRRLETTTPGEAKLDADMNDCYASRFAL